MSANPPQFVDTNILIYAHDLSAGPKHDRARELLQTLWRERSGCLSIQVLQEFYVNVTRKVAHPLSSEIHRPGVDDVLNAVRMQQRYQLAFWDAMILTSAHRLGCEVVWSEDLNAGQAYESMQVRNPFE